MDNWIQVYVNKTGAKTKVKFRVQRLFIISRKCRLIDKGSNSISLQIDEGKTDKLPNCQLIS